VLFGVVCADALGIEPLEREEAPPHEVTDEAEDHEVDTDVMRTRPPVDSESIAAANELPIAAVPRRIATVRIRRPRAKAANQEDCHE
jgi:hypothetical protein